LNELADIANTQGTDFFEHQPHYRLPSADTESIGNVYPSGD